jgi:SulP family sulfate permease
MGALYDINTYKIAFVIAIIASLETLLCVEATDKLDSKREITSTNRELKAQGLGNIISGLIGGLPITQVVVRSSANITFGAETKMSTILHGMFLLISVVFMVRILNLIPLSSLAPILILVGYKLISPKSFVAMLKLGYEQFIPFIFTIFAMLLTNLLDGVLLGLGLSLVFTLYHSYKNSYYMKSVTEITNGKERHHIVLAEEVTFFNKASIIDLLRSIKNDSKVIIDCTNTKSIAYDVVEFITEYCENANLKNIEVETINFKPIVLNKLH